MSTQAKLSTVATGAATAQPRALRVYGAIMVVVLLFGFLQAIMAMGTPTARDRLDGTLSLSSALSGRTAAAVNYVMAHQLPIDGVLRAAGGIFRWRIFDSGGPQVWVGSDNWLYLIEELRPWPDPSAAMAARAEIARQVELNLRARGIALLVAVVPDKSRIESGMLDGAPRAAQTVTRYADFIGLLRANGLTAVDLDAPLAAARRTGPVYYRTDTHWNQAGAAMAARAIAGAVTTSIARTEIYRSDADAVETDGPDDLLRLMSLDKVPDIRLFPLRPSPDRQFLEHTVPARPSASIGGLLGDGPTIDVVLIGSSFSLNANFIGRLQQALGTALLNFAKPGAGFSGAAQAYLGSMAYRDTPPKLVIWEIPERVVSQPLDATDRALRDLVQGGLTAINSDQGVPLAR